MICLSMQAASLSRSFQGVWLGLAILSTLFLRVLLRTYICTYMSPALCLAWHSGAKTKSSGAIAP